MAILKRGSKGRAVSELQALLNRSGAFPRLNPDGDFGQKTEVAVRSAQERLQLVVDGKAGPQTLKALRESIKPPSKSARVEPDKSAMKETPPPTPRFPDEVLLVAAPNAGTLKLLDTARPITEIIFHCTATPEGKRYTVADVRAWHKKRGFTDVGYHYLIDLDGTILIGRPIGQVGAHVANHNTGTIGVSYFGGVSADGKKAKDTRTPAQRASALWLIGTLAKKFNVKKITGHNEYANKACPSFNVQADPLSKLAA